jgi:hypothetical protein
MKSVSKIVIFNNKTSLDLKVTSDNQLKILFYTSNQKLFLKYRLSGGVTGILNSNKLFILRKLPYNSYTLILNKLTQSFSKLFFSQYFYFGKLHMIGLGFKNFVLEGKLYILVGDCNYIIFDIPSTLKIFCKKNQIYILSTDYNDALNFLHIIKKIKKPNFYKGKGVLEFKNFKFTKLKVGKKQRFV